MKPGMDEFCDSRQQPCRRCPFYGFSWPAASLRLQHEGGNRCGLALDRIAPCAMEEAGWDVDIRMCLMADKMVHFIRCASPVIAFVTPDHPEGLPYAEWRRRTMLPGAIEVTPELWPSGHHAEIGPKVK